MKPMVIYALALVGFLGNVAWSKEVGTGKRSTSEVAARSFNCPSQHFRNADLPDMIKFLNITWETYGGKSKKYPMRLEEGGAIPNPCFSIEIPEGSLFNTMNRLAQKAGLRVCYEADEIVLREIDMTNREHTDPLLRIHTDSRGLMPADDELFTEYDPARVEIQNDRTPESYKRLWGKNDVLMIHPISEQEHAFVDFSTITAHHKGNLKVYVKNDVRGDHELKIKVGETFVETESIDRGKWEFFKIKFDHQPVELQVHATGWQWEFSFISYRITE